MKIKELLSDETKWTKNCGAATEMDVNGVRKIVNPDDPSAMCWCLFGAILKCYPNRVVPIMEKVLPKLEMNITLWNDNPNRTFADVRKLVEELNI